MASCLLVAILGTFAIATAVAMPGSPSILEPADGGASLNPADIHMVVEFSDPDGHGHACSDWQIRAAATGELVWRADCVTGVLARHIHLGDGSFAGSHTGRTTLLHETEYTLLVRTWDDAGLSNQAVRDFETDSPGKTGQDALVPWEARPGYKVEKFATGLQLPMDLAAVPDPGPHAGDPFMYVAELYGDIEVVSRDGTVRDYATDLLNFDPTGKFPGSGEHGIGGIAVDPETGDVFASMVYEDEDSSTNPKPHYPKVVRFASHDGGRTAAGPGQTLIEMEGEPQGPSHQISNLTISPDGELYVHNGDGDDPDRGIARSLDSYRGKVLRMTLDGQPVPENPHYTDDGPPTASDYVYARGFRNPFGGAWRLTDSTHYTVENGPSTDRFAQVEKGEDYHWGDPAFDIAPKTPDDAMTEHAIYNWVPSHAPVGIAFVEPGRAGGSGFPARSMGNAFVTESGPTYASGPQEHGKRVVEFKLGDEGTLESEPARLIEYTGTGKATAVGLAAAEDGLYVTDLYKDQGQLPTDRGANVLRASYCGADCPTDDPPMSHPPGATPVDTAPTTGDRTSPKLRRVAMTRRVFRVRSHRKRPRASSRRVKAGTAFLFRLSEAATVRIALRRLAYGIRRGDRCRRMPAKTMRRLRKRSPLRRCLLPHSVGVRVRGRCRAPRRALWGKLEPRRRKAARRCLIHGLQGALRRKGTRGRNRVPFNGRIGQRPLVAGRYVAVLRAVDGSGNASRRRVVGFRVAPAR